MIQCVLSEIFMITASQCSESSSWGWEVEISCSRAAVPWNVSLCGSPNVYLQLYL